MNLKSALKKKLLWWVVGSLGAVGIGIIALIFLFGMVLLGVLVSSTDSSMAGIPVPQQEQFDIPVPLIPIYIRAENGRVTWARLAAIHKVSTDFGKGKAKRDDTIGSLGFPRSLWDRYQVDGDGDGEMDPDNPYDVIFSLANYFQQQPEEEAEEAALNALFLNPEDVNRVHVQENEYRAMLVIQDNWLWPLIGYTTLSSPYGMRIDPIKGGQAFHDGIDIPAPHGTLVVAVQDATVIEVISSSDGYGNLIRLQHKDGVQSFYGHLSKIGVQEGQQILRGEVIGWVGTTGNSTGPHLHLGMVKDGQSVDPQTFWVNKKVWE